MRAGSLATRAAAWALGGVREVIWKVRGLLLYLGDQLVRVAGWCNLMLKRLAYRLVSLAAWCDLKSWNLKAAINH